MAKKRECPICLEDITSNDPSYTLTIPCKHFYHKSCILSWTSKSASTCPQCRNELTSLFTPADQKTIKINHKVQDKLVDLINNHPSEPSSSIISTNGLSHIEINTESALSRPNGPLFSNTHQQVQQQLNTNIRHLSNQQCSICDNTVLITQLIICPQCSGLYHRSCCDGLNCPFCEEWIDDLACSTVTTKKRKTLDRSADDTQYYTKIVDDMKKRVKEDSSEKVEEQVTNLAWEELTRIKESGANGGSELRITNPLSPPHTSESNEKQLKTPKKRKKHVQLTESALSLLDPKFKRHEVVTIRGLSFTQKLLVQRLILKPRLRKEIADKLTFQAYTDLNKHLSHVLYGYIQKVPRAISMMNAVIELAEREGHMPLKDRKSLDKFALTFKGDTLIDKFKNCDWGDESILQNLIDEEIRKWI